MKFHLHDSAQRKTSERFNKIVDVIVTKIKRKFGDSVDIVASIENKAKKVFIGPVVTKAATEGTDVERARKDRLSKKKWEIMFKHYQDK